MKIRKWHIVTLVLIIAIIVIIFPMVIDSINDSTYAKRFDLQLPRPNTQILRQFSHAVQPKIRVVKKIDNAVSSQKFLDQHLASSQQNNAKFNLLSFNEDMGSVWVVQVATFKNKANAADLLKTLQRMQYRAYQRENISPNGIIYSVYIGPIMDFRRAQSINLIMEQKLSLKGIVKYYEPLL